MGHYIQYIHQLNDTRPGNWTVTASRPRFAGWLFYLTIEYFAITQILKPSMKCVEACELSSHQSDGRRSASLDFSPLSSDPELSSTSAFWVYSLSIVVFGTHSGSLWWMCFSWKLFYSGRPARLAWSMHMVISATGLLAAALAGSWILINVNFNGKLLMTSGVTLCGEAIRRKNMRCTEKTSTVDSKDNSNFP